MNYDLKSFDAIRPYADGEMKQGMEALLSDRQFGRLMHSFAPWCPAFLRNALIRLLFIGVNTPLQFQLRFIKPVAKYIVRKSTRGIAFQHDAISREGRYTFVSNHRDIVLDSAFLDLLLHLEGFPTTCEIAIGDNLLIYPWIRHIVRMNKAFIVRRSLRAKEMLESSLLMSQYMHYAIAEKQENIWIAQREGRAKDSSDNTQESVLKMLAMGGEGGPISSLRALNIVPLTISYEYDPCDYLKAQEFQLKRDNPTFKKSKQDDLDNMKTGIMGQKGRVRYVAAPCINKWLDEMSDLPRTELFAEIARRMDQNIHSNYVLFPSNYVALDELRGTEEHREHYTEADKTAFDAYLKGQLDKIHIENPDWGFLRERMLTMYANPVLNQNR